MGEENLNPRDAYRVMLRDYPDVLNIDQMCEILSVSTKTGYAILKRERPAFEGRTLLPHPQGTSFDLSHRIRTRSHHPGVTSLHSLLPLGTLMVSAAEVTYSSGCKDRRKHYGSRASARKKRLLLHRSEL